MIRLTALLARASRAIGIREARRISPAGRSLLTPSASRCAREEFPPARQRPWIPPDGPHTCYASQRPWEPAPGPGFVLLPDGIRDPETDALMWVVWARPNQDGILHLRYFQKAPLGWRVIGADVVAGYDLAVRESELPLWDLAAWLFVRIARLRLVVGTAVLRALARACALEVPLGCRFRGAIGEMVHALDERASFIPRSRS